MNQKIDSTHEEPSTNKEEFTRGFFPSLIFLTLVILIFVVASENHGEWLYKHGSRAFTSELSFFNLFPAIFSSGNTIANGLQTFSGKELTPTNLSLEIRVLANILIIYIIIPTVFFFNWHRRRIENKSISTINSLSFSSVIYALSIILTISVSATAITSAIMSHPIRQSLEHALAIQSDKDALINDLDLIALDAYQYRLLPKELGGGEGKYTGFVIAPDRAKTQNGIYAVTTSENQVTIKVQSLLFPSGIINLTVNEQGQTGDWQYEGVFR
jgi:hypothetical protein